MNYAKIFSRVLVCLLAHQARAQDNNFSGSAIRAGFGVGANDGNSESGLGILFAVGYQKSVGASARWRINPNLLIGGFSAAAIEDTPDQFYTTTALELNISYDIVRYKSVSLMGSTGGFVNYSRGLTGTEGELGVISSRYFNQVYAGGSAGFGVRVNPSKGPVALEFKPFTLQFGNKDFFLGYAMLAVDFKLRK